MSDEVKKINIKYDRPLGQKIQEFIYLFICLMITFVTAFVSYKFFTNDRPSEGLVVFCISSASFIATLSVLLILQLPEKAVLLDVIEEELGEITDVFECVTDGVSSVCNLYLGETGLVIDVLDCWLVTINWCSITFVSAQEGQLFIETNGASYCLVGSRPLQITVACETIIQNMLDNGNTNMEKMEDDCESD